MYRKNILHITHTNPFKDTRILNISESIEKINKKYNQFIIGINKDGFKEIQLNKRRIITIKLLGSRLPLYLKAIRKIIILSEFNIKIIIKCILIKPSVIHCHDLSGLYVGLIHKLFFKSKFIFDAHELEAHEAFVSPIEHIIRTIYEYLPTITCDHLITVSNSIALWYKWKGAKHITVIYNKPNKINNKNSSKISLLEKIPPTESGINLIYIGILEKHRGIENLLNTFKNLRPYNLYFLGEGTLERNIKEEIKNSNNLYLHKFVDKDDVIDFIKGFDYSMCLIEQESLSSYFGMPNKLFQSLSSGIPVIVYNNPDMSSFVNMNNYGIVINNVEDIPKLIERNLEKFEFFKSKINKNKLNFLWSSEFIKIRNIYESI